MNRSLLLFTVTGLAAICFAFPSKAQELGLRAYGFRGGISLNPDQFHFGVYADAGRLTRNVRFQPSFDLGLGNGVRLGAVNLDAVYLFKPRRWQPYAGGGLGVNFIDVSRGYGQDSGLDIEPALNVVGGVEWGSYRRRGFHRYLLEARLGLGDTPDFKMSAGVKF